MSKLKSRIFTAGLIAIFSVTLAAQTPPSDPPPAAASTTAPTRVSAAEQEKKLLKKVAPVYTKEAFDAKLTGVVSLETVIGIDGKVKSVRPLGNANALLIKAAADAVKQWVYMPTSVDKMKVEVITIVSINFKVGE